VRFDLTTLKLFVGAIDHGSIARQSASTWWLPQQANASRTSRRQGGRDLIVPVLGAPKCDRLIAAVYAIETLADVRTLRPLLQAA
jgi:hypothetical protein